MNISEAVRVLGKCSSFDNREPSEAMALAWAEAMPDITEAEAMDAVTAHYRVTDAWITPAAVRAATVAARKRNVTNHEASSSSIPCNLTDCVCAHDGACQFGWIDNDNGSTTPCRWCRPHLARKVAAVRPLGQRTAADEAILRGDTETPIRHA